MKGDQEINLTHVAQTCREPGSPFEELSCLLPSEYASRTPLDFHYTFRSFSFHPAIRRDIIKAVAKLNDNRISNWSSCDFYMEKRRGIIWIICSSGGNIGKQRAIFFCDSELPIGTDLLKHMISIFQYAPEEITWPGFNYALSIMHTRNSL